jgi:hypothetical protein
MSRRHGSPAGECGGVGTNAIVEAPLSVVADV